MNARAGSAYISSSGTRRQHERRGAGVAGEHLGQDTRANSGAAALLGRLVQGRQRQGMPEHFAQTLGLPPADEPGVHGFTRRCGRAVRPRRPAAVAWPSSARRGGRRHASASQFHHAGHHVERRRAAAGTPAAIDRPRRSIIVTLQLRLRRAPDGSTRRCARETRMSPCSSRAGCAGRCRRARRSRCRRQTPWRVHRAGPWLRARAPASPCAARDGPRHSARRILRRSTIGIGIGVTKRHSHCFSAITACVDARRPRAHREDVVARRARCD